MAGRGIKLNKCEGLYFDELTHTYLTDDDRQLVGVTTLMKMMGVGADYSGIPAEVLEKAAERGSAVHKAIETWCVRGEAFINEEYADEVIADLEAFKWLELPVLANEYLVSDMTHIASSIDIVLKDLTLVDIKTTSKVHWDAVSWQLSIYKWLFELQNPRKKVKGLKVLHLRGGKWEYEDVEEKPREQVLALVSAYKDGVSWVKPAEKPIAITSEQGEALEAIRQLEEKIVSLDKVLKDYKAQQEAQKSAVMEFMKAHNLSKWEVSDSLSFTYVEPTTRVSLDSTRLKKDLPEVWEQYKKETQVKESLRINI